MVFISIPANNTEEENILKQKYQKLKRKKKALQALKTPKPEPPPSQQTLKRSSDSLKQDAKEYAKKLLKTGAIPSIKPDKDKQKAHVFKRSKSIVKTNTNDSKPSGYQPFQSNVSNDNDMDLMPSNDGSESPSGSNSSTAISPKSASPRARYKSLSETFVSSKSPDSEPRTSFMNRNRKDSRNFDLPTTGNTIYVNYPEITETFLRTEFSNFGTITNINVENKNNCGFISFETNDQAAKAITEMKNQTVNGLPIEVSLAKRQPIVQPNVSQISLSQTKDYWRVLADNYNRDNKSPLKEKREIKSYDDL